MTRDQILEQFIVRDNLVWSPGKFENEPLWTVYFWEAYLNGGGNDDGLTIEFDITPEDVAEFPELASSTRAHVWSDDNGFVYGELE